MTELDHGNAARMQAGFLTSGKTSELSTTGVVIFDPFSTLISAAGITLSPGVTIWPGVILETGNGGTITIGANVQLFSGTRIVAKGGRVGIGSDSEIGEEGGFTIKAESEGCEIRIGSGARILGGGSMALGNTIGDGAQVLGPIRMQNCELGAGGSHREPDPDKRGAVLKGSGVARQITVPTGMVIQAFGLFSEAPMRPQSYFHPKPGK